MEAAVKEYDARLDSKKRLTIRNALFEYYHVSEKAYGTIILEPRELTVPFSVSENALRMMDEAVRNMNEGHVSDPVDLSSF